MPGLQSTTAFLESLGRENPFGEAQVAAAAFLARYSGRTLDAYRFDLRSFFQWATDAKLPVLDATRPHIELYRTTLEERGLAAPTIDRRLSTVCGFYRFAHIDGRISSNPAQYVRRPKVYPSEGRGMDRGELGTFLFTAERFDRDHAALSVLLGRFPVSLMCRRVTHSIGVCGQSQRDERSFRDTHNRQTLVLQVCCLVRPLRTPSSAPVIQVSERKRGAPARQRNCPRLTCAQPAVDAYRFGSASTRKATRMDRRSPTRLRSQSPYGNPEGISFRQVARAFRNSAEFSSMFAGTAMWTVPPVNVGSGMLGKPWECMQSMAFR